MRQILSLIGKSIRAIGRAFGVAGRATVALVGICGVVAAIANYNVTPGSGLAFGSVVVSSVHYAQQLICDLTAPATQCATVKAGNTMVAADVAVAVSDPNVLAAVQAAVPSQSPAVPIGGVSICDGANGATNPCTTPVTVKAASTPAAATDKALVVDQRPGTNIPVTQSGTWTVQPGNTANTTPWLTTNGAGDPCRAQVASYKNISITTATTTNIVTGTSAKKLYVCYLYLQTAAANNVAVISGTTGATCGANTAGLIGGTTAANGLNNAANSGQAIGTGGYAVAAVATNNDDICIITSAATPLAGVIKYVVQ